MTSVVLALLVVAVQAVTGAVWWRAARGSSVRVLEALGMGLALGTAAATLSGLALFSVLPVQVAWAVPTVLTLLALPWLARRHRGAGPRWRATPWLPAVIALVVGGLAGLGSIAVNLRNYPLMSEGTTSTYHPDMLFFEALSTSLARLGPSDSIFMAGAELRYHWFTYAWAGQVSATVGAEPFVVLTRVLPLVALVGTVLIAIAWTQRMTSGRWAPALAVLLLVAGGYVGATYGTILNFDSPSQAMTTVWMLGLAVASLAVVRRSTPSRGQLWRLVALIGLLSAATTGGKISSVAVVIAGWGFVALVATVRREPWLVRAWLSLMTMALGTGIVYFAVIAGSAEQGGLGLGSLLNKASSVQGLNPTDYWWGILAGTVILGLAIVPRWAGVLWLVFAHSTRWRPATVFSVGAGASSLLSLLLLSGGLNDTWFALAASGPLAVTSAVGGSRAIQSTFPGRGWRPSVSVVITTITSVLLAGAVTLLWRAGPGDGPSLRWLGPLAAAAGAVLIGLVVARLASRRRSFMASALALTVLSLVTLAVLGRALSANAGAFAVQADSGFSPTEFRPFVAFTEAVDTKPVTSWSPAQADTAAWLRANARTGDLTATNITFSPFVPALTQQPMLVSAIGYQAPYGRPASIDVALQRELDSWVFIYAPDADAVLPLCAAGVDWLWVDPARTEARDWRPFASPVIVEADVILLRLEPSVC